MPLDRPVLRRVLLITSVLMLGPLTAIAGHDDRMIDRRPYTFPSWETAVETTDAERYATAEAYSAAAADEDFVLEKLRYRSDGLAVVAYLYRPTIAPDASRPVIVFNRGGFVRGDIAPELLPMFHRLAKAGFTIIAPMYRGSDGGEGRDEMGGQDLNDLMNIADLLRELNGLDADNVFLYGESRGGMMVLQAVRDGFPARAAATFGAFTDLEAMVSNEQGLAMAHAIWPDFDSHRAQIIERRSASRWPETLDLHLLLMHGGADESVSPTHTLRLAVKLADAETPDELGVIVFPGDNHTLDRHRLERDRRAIEFFRRHMAD